ncbi:hypothetical protein DKX38_021122 [Salix brachista]|uniref:Brix domain-containing protein n=1 Tax=Salix brachista TaxID=2182728 RepID=A0A5N5KBR5_9ROSI|nr:hypothetical protein DKX38_021122 [Salix brachista]
MGTKRKKSESETMEDYDDDVVLDKKEEKKMKQMEKEKKKEILPSMIKNKEKRSAFHAKLKLQKKVEKRKKLKARDAEEKRALELGEEPPPRKIPRTIENTREFDETVCKPDDELYAGNDADEFSSVLKRERIPKILITTSRFNSTRGPAFISELLEVIPNAHYYKRGTYDLKKIVEYAKKQDFTSLIVVHTNRREPDALLIIGLPDGPTAHFKLSRLVLRKDIKNHGNPTSHEPELVLTNFTTHLGHRIGRYIFETKESKQGDSKGKNRKDGKGEKNTQEKVIARLQECGPRFTLKLRSLQHETFDTKGGEYEWVHKVTYECQKWTPAEGGFSCELHLIVYLSWSRIKFWCISGWYLNK